MLSAKQVLLFLDSFNTNGETLKQVLQQALLGAFTIEDYSEQIKKILACGYPFVTMDLPTTFEGRTSIIVHCYNQNKEKVQTAWVRSPYVPPQAENFLEYLV